MALRTKAMAVAGGLAVLAALLGQVEPDLPQPAAAPPEKGAAGGSIAGVITSASPVTKIIAVDRQWVDVLKISKDDPQDKFVYPGKWDAQTGTFTVTGLLPGRSYDLIVWNKEGRWEGVNMSYHRPIVPAEPVTDEDKTWLKDNIEKMPEFYDKCRILWMAADHKHATLLVELMRTRDFHGDKGGEIIYRVELWYFENLFGGWAKDRNTERVMSRWRGGGASIPRNWQYVPQLGGIAVGAAGKSEPVNITLPEKADKKRGLAGGL